MCLGEMKSTLESLQNQASRLQLGLWGLMGPATLGPGSHVDSPHCSLRLVSSEIQQSELSPSRINCCGPWGQAPKQQPGGAACSWRCESKYVRHRSATSGLSCTHISLPTRTWFPGSGWQLGCAPGSRLLIPPSVLTVWERKGSLTRYKEDSVSGAGLGALPLLSRLQDQPLSTGHRNSEGEG